jgi:hypothetical protein
VDYAVPMQALRLSSTQETLLIAAMQAQMPDLEAIFWEHGFLNLRFSQALWLALWMHWCHEPASFLAAAEIPNDLGDIPIMWRYRLLKTFHQSAVIAEVEGWQQVDMSDYLPSTSELQMLKSLLGLGGVLHQKSELAQKRLQMMTQIQEQIALLWQNPILTPTDLQGSAWRQGVLRLALKTAEAIGDPQTQSLAASIPLHFVR